jgi:hypothetical protein
VVARLVPVSRERPRSRASAGVSSTLDRVAREIGTRWPRGRSATEAVREGRREASRRCLTRHVADGGLVIAPALLLPEVAGAVARRTGEPRLARRAADAVLQPRLVEVLLPGDGE